MEDGGSVGSAQCLRLSERFFRLDALAVVFCAVRFRDKVTKEHYIIHDLSNDNTFDHLE